MGQYNYMFRAIGQSSSLKLKTLVLSGLIMNQVDPETLALAVTKIEGITFYELNLKDSYEVIFRAISQCKPADLHLQTLRVVNCYYVSEVSPEILASAVCRLVSCSLFQSNVTSDQLEELCRQIASYENIQLSYLSLGAIEDFGDVDKDILASAVVRIDTFVMAYYYTGAQLLAILNKAVDCNDSKLKVLNLGVNINNLEDLDIDEPETRSILMKAKEKMNINADDWDSDTDFGAFVN